MFSQDHVLPQFLIGSRQLVDLNVLYLSLSLKVMRWVTTLYTFIVYFFIHFIHIGLSSIPFPRCLAISTVILSLLPSHLRNERGIHWRMETLWTMQSLQTMLTSFVSAFLIYEIKNRIFHLINHLPRVQVHLQHACCYFLTIFSHK